MSDAAAQTWTEPQMSREPASARVLRILAIIALVEAIVLMTATLFVGVWLDSKIDAATRELGKFGQSFGASTPTEAPSGIDSNAGDYTDAELRDYQANPGQFCASNPGHPLCP
jgi:hypothetical protein